MLRNGENHMSKIIRAEVSVGIVYHCFRHDLSDAQLFRKIKDVSWNRQFCMVESVHKFLNQMQFIKRILVLVSKPKETRN